MRAAVAILALLALGGCAADVATIEQPSMYVSMASPGARLDLQAAASMISLYRQNNGLGAVVVDPDLAPNPKHPLAGLSTGARTEAQVRDLAQVLAAIVKRRMEPASPSKEVNP